MSSNKIDDECLASLGEYLNVNHYLEGVSLGNNLITDQGIKTLSEYLIGNTFVKELGLNGNEAITEKSSSLLIDIVKGSCITEMFIAGTSLSDSCKKELPKLLKIPCDQRAIPTFSTSKSAAKATSSASAW